MHLAYCLHVAPTLGTRLIHGKRVRKRSNNRRRTRTYVQQHCNHRSVLPVGLADMALCQQRSNGQQAENTTHEKQGHRRNEESATDPDIEQKKHRHNRERPGDRRHAESATGPGAEPGTGPDTHSRYLNITIPHSASWQCASATCKSVFPHNLLSAAAACLSFSRPGRLDIGSSGDWDLADILVTPYHRHESTLHAARPMLFFKFKQSPIRTVFHNTEMPFPTGPKTILLGAPWLMLGSGTMCGGVLEDTWD